jgi:hypothetical protein
MAKKIEKDKKTVELELHVDTSIKNVWVDNLHMAVREDDVCVVRLSTYLPEGYFEQVRFMTNKNQLKDFIEILCSTINYYPDKNTSTNKE